jgi:hypothetical protein
MAHKVRKELKV